MNTPIDAFSDASKLPANPYACFPPKTVGTLNYTRLPTQQRDAKAPSNSEISARDRAVLDARTELFVLRERRSGYRQKLTYKRLATAPGFKRNRDLLPPTSPHTPSSRPPQSAAPWSPALSPGTPPSRRGRAPRNPQASQAPVCPFLSPRIRQTPSPLCKPRSPDPWSASAQGKIPAFRFRSCA